MNIVEISFEDAEPPPWEDKVPPFCGKVLEYLSLDNWEVSIVFCSNVFMRELNLKFRGKDESTDVLSFSQTEGEDDFPHFREGASIVGDIVISLDMLKESVRDFSVRPGEELKRLIIHGILHLSGHDHRDNDPDRPMLILQEEILQHLSEERIF